MLPDSALLFCLVLLAVCGRPAWAAYYTTSVTRTISSTTTIFTTPPTAISTVLTTSTPPVSIFVTSVRGQATTNTVYRVVVRSINVGGPSASGLQDVQFIQFPQG